MENLHLPTRSQKSKAVTFQRNIPIITFYLGDHLFGVHAESVMEINKDLDITPVPLAPAYILGIMNLRGQIIPVIDLAKKISFKKESIPKLNLIIRYQDEVASFFIDRISDIIEVPEFKLEDPPEKVEGFDKAYIEKIYQMPDRILTILKVSKLFDY